ncbi:hypothetical protein IQ254_30105 [Nodosilinea sp. LEGE 07088]|uniref:hypothetical protein n=1 Tax=Nodosilinea sp. LEGE 07088 TaxID=2777968 RepID=UPI0018817A6B|nr:hypothetical protein [Nodosilinea sp. LEGE 07088]MBE9141398.1 hypothetical protein [Nodosilinea sp. LEGE 07088]
MLFFQLLPDLPPATATANIPIAAVEAVGKVKSESDCEPGSRDCFPKDLVGQLPTAFALLPATPDTLTLAALLQAGAEAEGNTLNG